ncbi:hypothetical protein EJ08DRAFT_22859 [Tothia fuscella]|uniref:Heterokaryon incompatibility domain-containing protein n=1 Tax=Tothia fuscella TaxID=1048955 RepID=A0A9P4NYM6_9PEZI|nr:hypothetical protein EJ08DRAFT_22859 [Tothia fuscella]
MDQICINQKNARKRTHQVGFMRDIYRHAKQTLVCLSNGNCIASSVLRGWLDQLVKITQFRYSFKIYPKIKRHIKNATAEQAQSLIGIFFSAWWMRAWVYQEFIVSSDVHFLYSGCCIHWKGLKRLNFPAVASLQTQWPEIKPRDVAALNNDAVNIASLLLVKQRWKGASNLSVFFY